MIGKMEELPREVVSELELAMERTSANKGLRFNVALNYGGRAEIVEACRSIVRLAKECEGELEIDEQMFSQHMFTAGQPDPDLLIRTSGEMRVSNFLLWQIAYAEIWVTETLWPDFRRRDLFEAIVDFQKRDRRYGGIHKPTPQTPNKSYAIG